MPIRARISNNRVRGFSAAWAGIALDGMDSFIYPLVLVPAMRELLPASGIPTTTASLGGWGSIMFSAFLIGWGSAFLWGPLADRFGRVRTLIYAILCYSLFTFLGSVSRNVWELAAFRLFAGFGVGGEFVGAAVFAAEELGDDTRALGAGVLNSAYYVGSFIAAGLNYWIGARYGWRAMFAVGGFPALFIAFIRYGVAEPERWRKRVQASSGVTARESFFALFSLEYRGRTALNCVFLLISMIGLWAGSVYVPGAVTELAVRAGASAVEAVHIASRATMLLASGTIAGCLFMPLLATRWGRRPALAFYFTVMAASVALGFGYFFYMPREALRYFLPCLFFIGFGGANFSVYLLWVPEQYRTESRGSALALALSIGRYVAAGATFLIGAGISHYGTIGKPVALTSIAFLAGLALIPFAVETRGRPLPP